MWGGLFLYLLNCDTMNLLIGIVRKVMGVFTGSSFAKGTGVENNGMTIYRFSDRRGDNDGRGNSKRLQPVPVSAK